MLLVVARGCCRRVVLLLVLVVGAGVVVGGGDDPLTFWVVEEEVGVLPVFVTLTLDRDGGARATSGSAMTFIDLEFWRLLRSRDAPLALSPCRLSELALDGFWYLPEREPWGDAEGEGGG